MRDRVSLDGPLDPDTAIIVAATATRQSAELRGGTNQRLLHAD